MPIETELAAVYALYAALARDLDPELGLGGKLLYAGELTPEGCLLVRAANIAGAASLSVTADPDIQRKAIREGVVDFLVTSLNEALRILKNEIRKRQTVSVCVSNPAAQIEAEMRERGVLPDLLPPAPLNPSDLGWFESHGGMRIQSQASESDRTFLVVDGPTPEWEARALASMPLDDHANRRWVRLSPRYLGPSARRLRSLATDPETATILKPPVPGH